MLYLLLIIEHLINVSQSYNEYLSHKLVKNVKKLVLSQKIEEDYESIAHEPNQL